MDAIACCHDHHPNNKKQPSGSQCYDIGLEKIVGAIEKMLSLAPHCLSIVGDIGGQAFPLKHIHIIPTREEHMQVLRLRRSTCKNTTRHPIVGGIILINEHKID